MSERVPFAPVEVEVQSALAAQIPCRSSNDPSEIGRVMSEAFDALGAFARRYGLRFAGPPRSIYTGHGPEGSEFIVAVPVTAPPTQPVEEGSATVGEIPGGSALRFAHRGSYRQLITTYKRITEWMRETGRMESEADWEKYMPMWEEYLNDPESTPEDELLTHIYLPLS